MIKRSDHTLAMLSTLSLALAALALPVAVNAQGYRVYGGEVEAPEKSVVVEECEYRALIEEQRCNTRINKSDCIKEIHRECAKLAEDPAGPADGNAPAPRQDIDSADRLQP